MLPSIQNSADLTRLLPTHANPPSSPFTDASSNNCNDVDAIEIKTGSGERIPKNALVNKESSPVSFSLGVTKLEEALMAMASSVTARHHDLSQEDVAHASSSGAFDACPSDRMRHGRRRRSHEEGYSRRHDSEKMRSSSVLTITSGTPEPSQGSEPVSDDSVQATIPGVTLFKLNFVLNT